MALCDSDCRYLAMWHFLFKHIKCNYEGLFTLKIRRTARLRPFTDRGRLVGTAFFPLCFNVFP